MRVFGIWGSNQTRGESVMDELDKRLMDFASLMKMKFIERESKHPGKDSVTHHRFDWIYGLSAGRMESHLLSEISERESAISDEDKMSEDIDLANMAFLDFQARRSNKEQDRY